MSTKPGADDENEVEPISAVRADTGRFVAGRSGNPGGRPRAEVTLRALAQARGPAVVAALVGLVADRAQDGHVRVLAARELLNRGFGRAALPLPETGDNRPAPIGGAAAVEAVLALDTLRALALFARSFRELAAAPSDTSPEAERRREQIQGVMQRIGWGELHPSKLAWLPLDAYGFLPRNWVPELEAAQPSGLGEDS